MLSPYGDTATCTSELNITFGIESFRTSNRDWIYCKVSKSFFKQLSDTYLITASISDANGVVSNTASVKLKLDATPPPRIKTELIEVSGIPHGTLTIKGLPGAIPGAGDPSNSWLTVIETYPRTTGGQVALGGNREHKHNQDGSFEVTINGQLGQSIRFRNYDYAVNQSNSYLGTSAHVEISITSPTNNAFLTENKITVTGTHDGDEDSTITVNGINATITGDTFTAQNVPIDDSGTVTADILASNGAKGTSTVNVSVGYPINIQVDHPSEVTTVYSQKILVSGTHNGPEGTVITVNGATASINGTLFSKEIEIDPYTGAIEILASGPNSGYGKTSFSVIYMVPTPSTELINLTFNQDDTVTLLGKPGSAIANGVVTIYNTTRGTMKDAFIAPDGSFSVTISATGGNTLALSAKDKNGIEGGSTTISAGYLADIAITSPLDGSEVGPYVTVTGSHSGPAKSAITVNGVSATITDSTFSASNVPASTGSITAKLYSTDGAYGISSVSVSLDTTPPAVPDLTLINTTFSAGNHAHVSGEAGSVEEGAMLTITNTTQNESKTLTVDDDGSFSAYLPGLPGEALSLTATDAVGNQGEAVTISLGSEAMITIDSPYEGTIIPALVDTNGNLTGLVNVTGSHNGPVNSGIVVNGVVAAVSADQYVALNVPVAADGIINAKLTALDGSHGTAQLTVGLNEQPYLLSLTPSSTEGMAPHSISFDWNAYTVETPTQVSIDYDGDGIFDQSSSDLTTQLQHDYTLAGINNVTLRITMADGTYHSAETVVVTHDSSHYDAIFLSLWDGMNKALLAGVPDVALRYLSPPAQHEYAKTFQVIAPHMQSIMDSYGQAARSDIGGGYLEYVIERIYPDAVHAHYVYSMQGKDGLWRLSSM